MKYVKSKFPIKVGNVLIPKGAEGFLLSFDESSFIKYRLPNMKETPDSQQVIANFPNHFHREFICSVKQIQEID